MDTTVTDNFYEKVIGKLKARGEIGVEESVLVVAGGPRDRDAWLQSGFSKVTISNLDERMKGDEFSPFSWSFQDAEKLSFPDNCFDFVAIHNGLHHCVCPQNAILEMLRVARKGILLYEPYDNLITQIGCRLGVGQQYETAAVFYNGGNYGGVRNGPVANFIYRFTRNELRKTVATAYPHSPVSIEFFHELRIPWVQLRGRRNPIPYWFALASLPILSLVAAVFPTQTNCFAAMIRKSEDDSNLFPWIKRSEQGELIANMQWLSQRYVQSDLVK